MRYALRLRILAFIIANSLLVPAAAFAQQGRETRPRRIGTDAKSASPRSPETGGNQKTAAPDNQPQWQTVPASIATPNSETASGAEPLIRVALAVDARSASVSTTSHLMRAGELAATLVPLDVARVHVEPHLLSPLPASTAAESFRLKLAGLASRAEAEEQAKQIRAATADECQPVLDGETQTWGLLIGPRQSREEAEAAQARLDEAGFAAIVIDLSLPSESTPSATNDSLSANAQPNPSVATALKTASPATASPVKPKTPSTFTKTNSPNNVRLASRTSIPTRELVTSATAGKLFSSSAPVMFASDDEAKAPIRFNDKPYRGRIEVFANSRGLLTVVNVLGLEDYVRGVVANELSPGGYPALEALKAQAIAARTYALKNRGQFVSQGFDLLPTTRSQVYRGLASENSLSTRAVDDTRGLIATYNGEPINALYTSTCGGRTENSENIFNEAVPYLRGRECAVEGRSAFAPFTIKTSRESFDLREEKYVPLAREVATLAIHGFGLLPARVVDSWLSSATTITEIRAWLGSVAMLSHHSLPVVPDDANRPAAFATALNAAAFGESRADTLLNNADVEYFLAIRDASDVPAANRADVALMVRDGYLSVFPDVTLRPREAMSHARVLHALARLLENRGLLQLQKGTARPAVSGTLILRSARGKDQPLRISDDVYLFRQIGETIFPVRSLSLVGGEPVMFHVNPGGAVDYLEVRPAPNGAAADRFSPFSNWTTELSPGQIKSRLGRVGQGIGSISDLRVMSRGSSRRVTDLEVIGSGGTAHVHGGHIRSALGLREQLFVVDKHYDADGHMVGFVFTGRGWGHGVGMCQVGAYGLARQGWSAEQILKAYYTGIELTRMY